MAHREPVIVKTNHYMVTQKKDSNADFHGMIDFFESSYLAYAMTSGVSMNERVLGALWKSAATDDDDNLVYNLGNHQVTYTITADVINEVLGLPRDNFVEEPEMPQYVELLTAIGYAGPMNALHQLTRMHLRKEWSFFFDALTKVFTGKVGGYDNITSLVLTIAYAVLKDFHINIGQLILNEIIEKVSTPAYRYSIYYGRFLQMIVDHQTGGVPQMDGDNIVAPMMQGARIFATLNANNHNAHVAYVAPEVLAGILQYPPPADADSSADNAEGPADDAGSSSSSSTSSSSGDNPSPPPPPITVSPSLTKPLSPSLKSPSSTQHTSTISSPPSKRYKVVVSGPKDTPVQAYQRKKPISGGTLIIHTDKPSSTKPVTVKLVNPSAELRTKTLHEIPADIPEALLSLGEKRKPDEIDPTEVTPTKKQKTVVYSSSSSDTSSDAIPQEPVGETSSQAPADMAGSSHSLADPSPSADIPQDDLPIDQTPSADKALSPIMESMELDTQEPADEAHQQASADIPPESSTQAALRGTSIPLSFTSNVVSLDLGHHMCEGEQKSLSESQTCVLEKGELMSESRVNFLDSEKGEGEKGTQEGDPKGEPLSERRGEPLEKGEIVRGDEIPQEKNRENVVLTSVTLSFPSTVTNMQDVVTPTLVGPSGDVQGRNADQAGSADKQVPADNAATAGDSESEHLETADDFISNAEWARIHNVRSAPGPSTSAAGPSTSAAPQPRASAFMIEEEGLENADAWMQDVEDLSLEEVMARIREEYITYVGPSTKLAAPADVFDAIVHVYKSNLKFLHMMAAGLQDSLREHNAPQDDIVNAVNKRIEEILNKYLPISRLGLIQQALQQFNSEQKATNALKDEVASLRDQVGSAVSLLNSILPYIALDIDPQADDAKKGEKMEELKGIRAKLANQDNFMAPVKQQEIQKEKDEIKLIAQQQRAILNSIDEQRMKLAEERRVIDQQMQELEANRQFMAETERMRKYIAENEELCEAINTVEKLKDSGSFNKAVLARIIAEEEAEKARKAKGKGKAKVTTADQLKKLAKEKKQFHQRPASERLLAASSAAARINDERSLAEEEVLPLILDDGTEIMVPKSDPRYAELLARNIAMMQVFEQSAEDAQKATQGVEVVEADPDAPADVPSADITPSADQPEYLPLDQLLVFAHRGKFYLTNDAGRRVVVKPRSGRGGAAVTSTDPFGMFVRLLNGRMGFLYFNKLVKVETGHLPALMQQITRGGMGSSEKNAVDFLKKEYAYRVSEEERLQLIEKEKQQLEDEQNIANSEDQSSEEDGSPK